MKPWLLLGSTACALVTGCTEPNLSYNPDPLVQGECREGRPVAETFEGFERPGKLDILVVVDTHGSVTDDQEALAEALPAMLEGLVSKGLDVRLAVAGAHEGSVDIAPAASQGQGCQDNAREIAQSGEEDWTRVAACNVQQGASQSPRTQPLGVVEQILRDRPEGWRRFERPDARKLVVILSEEDDCTLKRALPESETELVRNLCVWNPERMSGVADWVSSVQSAVLAPEALGLAVIAGPPSAQEIAPGEPLQPVCQGALGAPFASNRLFEATQRLGERGFFQSLCTESLAAPLQAIAERLGPPSAITLCPARPLVHDPLLVSVTSADGQEVALEAGDRGFAYLGPTAQCPNGALRVSDQALDDAQSVRAHYCTAP